MKAQQTNGEIEDPILGYVDRTIVHQWRPLKDLKVTNQTSCTTVPRDQDTTPPPCDQEKGKNSYLSVGCCLYLYLTRTLSPKDPFFVVSQKPMPFAQLSNEVSRSTVEYSNGWIQTIAFMTCFRGNAIFVDAHAFMGPKLCQLPSGCELPRASLGNHTVFIW